MPKAGQPLPRPGDPELRSRIIEELQKGLSFAVAAANCGLGESTIFAWMKQGRQDLAADVSSPHREFLEHIARAHDAATGRLESKLYEIALEGKRPDITLAVLRVRKPDPWRDVVAIEAGTDENGDAAKTEDEIRAELARLRRITGQRAGPARSAGTRARTRSGARSTGKPGESAGVQ